MNDFDYYPPLWFLSRVCEEFNCTPEEAKKQDYDEVQQIIEMRSLYRAVTAPEGQRTPEQEVYIMQMHKLFEEVWGWKLRKAMDLQNNAGPRMNTNDSTPRTLSGIPVMPGE